MYDFLLDYDIQVLPQGRAFKFLNSYRALLKFCISLETDHVTINNCTT